MWKAQDSGKKLTDWKNQAGKESGTQSFVIRR